MTCAAPGRVSRWKKNWFFPVRRALSTSKPSCSLMMPRTLFSVSSVCRAAGGG